MLPIKTILHATDFSEGSDFAFRLACSLARDYKARLIVLHVAEIPPVSPEVGMAAPWIGANPELREKLELLRPHYPSVPVEHRLVEGFSAADEIVQAARETKCDVIVLGTHGRTGLLHLLLGSVAEQVVRKAPCPVVTVRAPAGQAPKVPAGEAVAAGIS